MVQRLRPLWTKAKSRVAFLRTGKSNLRLPRAVDLTEWRRVPLDDGGREAGLSGAEDPQYVKSGRTDFSALRASTLPLRRDRIKLGRRDELRIRFGSYPVHWRSFKGRSDA